MNLDLGFGFRYQNHVSDVDYVNTYYHSELEWGFWFGFWQGWIITHIYDFCIPLDFLGIIDLKKIEKGQENF